MPIVENPHEKKNEEPAGLVCKKCGCRMFKVIWTRHRPGGRILRKRKCEYCGKPMITVERSIG